MKSLGVALIGTGFMGKAHAFAYRSAHATFPEVPEARLEIVADVTEEAAAKAAAQYGFARSTMDWRAAVADPKVDIVSITTPNSYHKEMALAAIAAGKHVHCEKPLAPSLADAEDMVKAAEARGVVTQTGFNYIKNPLLKMARDMIAAGDLGEITGFRGIHAEDYMTSPDGVWTWRLDPKGGPGVVADLGSHIICMARFLLGPISELTADLDTVVKTRPVAPGAKERKPVEVDDIARLMVRFERGCGGTIEANWVSAGRKMLLGFEVHGSKGALHFNQENLNVMEFHRFGADGRTGGFTRIEAGPQHAPYGNFCVAGGHQLGFNDLKTIEMAEFMGTIAGGPKSGPDFREAYEVQKVVMAAVQSSKARSWLKV